MHAQLLATVGPLDAGTLLAGRYRILAKVGEGGFGMVYKACDTHHKRRLVAIKQIDLGALGPRQIIEATDSYNREVTLLSRLSHPNLPRVYDHFTDPTHWYLVMQYIEGEPLDGYLKRTKEGHLPAKEVCAIGVQLTNVLRFLHAHQPPIIFRDVKPGNIMRTRRGRLYLIDFGIARRFNPDKKRDTGPLGSPGYAAPEQYGRAQSTEQTDIYGLGATLHTLLTGREPLDEEPASPPAQQSGQEEQQLQQFLDRMQATDAAGRPRSMREVKEGLLSLQQRYPIQKVTSFLIGLLIGSVGWLLFLFLPFVWPASLSFPYYAMPWFVVLFEMLFILWPAVLFCQCLLVFLFFFVAHPHQRLLATGILVMLVLIFSLGMLFGWLPSLIGAFNTIYNKAP